MVLNVLTLLIYDPLYYTDKDGPIGPPQWIYFTCAFFLATMFCYIHPSMQVGPWSLHVPEFRRCGWVSGVISPIKMVPHVQAFEVNKPAGLAWLVRLANYLIMVCINILLAYPQVDLV